MNEQIRSGLQEDDRDPLSFWILGSDGETYEADVREFANGRTSEQVAAKNRHAWAGDYTGRPAFAAEFAKVVRSVKPSAESFKGYCTALRSFFRFLDIAAPDVGSALQVTDGMGSAYARWLGEQSGSYRLTKTVLDLMRADGDAPRLFWPARERDKLAPVEAIDELGMKRLYSALKSEARQIKAMFAEGERLAARGEDPRGRSARQGFQSAAWHRRENHAWLVKELTKERLIARKELMKLGGQGLIKANDPNTQKHRGPEYLAPGMKAYGLSARGQDGMVGKLRWFYPSYHDTAVYLWLFLIGTGWNLSTALALDVSSDESWFQPHPQKSDFVVLHGFKERADRHQFTLSMRRPEWHPFRIVEYMVERTHVLRATLRSRLAELEERREESPKMRAEIAEVERRLRSPWLYHVVNKTGEVSAFNNDDSIHLNNAVRAVIEKHALSVRHPSLVKMTTSVARDAWIGHAYVQSGYHVLLTRLASQHRHVRTLKYYLRSRRYREHSEDQVRAVQNAVFAEINCGRVLDPTRLRLLVQNGEITSEQETRLLDLRKRTRLGMGCLRPTQPPASIAPDHVEGTLCRVQRCTGCKHGVVFAESLIPLSRARAELIFIRREIPMAAWMESSFEDELASLEATLAQFDAAQVEAETSAWLEKLKSGEASPHDTYPAY